MVKKKVEKTIFVKWDDVRKLSNKALHKLIRKDIEGDSVVVGDLPDGVFTALHISEQLGIPCRFDFGDVKTIEKADNLIIAFGAFSWDNKTLELIERFKNNIFKVAMISNEPPHSSIITTRYEEKDKKIIFPWE